MNVIFVNKNIAKQNTFALKYMYVNKNKTMVLKAIFEDLKMPN